jgi:choice-of-anchor B domain-containing protein
MLAAFVAAAIAPASSGAAQDTVADTMQAVTGGEVKCTNGKAKLFDCQNTDLISFLPTAAIGAKSKRMYGKTPIFINSIWGWVDSATKREFAIIGRVDGTSFVEVTDPATPKYLGELPAHEGTRPNFWRDIKVYKNHAFIVADQVGPHGMQVFDLTQLRDVKTAPMVFQETAHYDGFANAHTIALNEATGYAYAVGVNGGGESCGGALHMIDVRNPTGPVFAGCYAEPKTGKRGTGYTHETQCTIYRGPDAQYKGRELCFNGSETAVGIVDVTDKKQPKTISIAAYPNASYTHQGWLSEDHRYFFLNDETDDGVGGIDKTRTIVFDLSDLDDPVMLMEFYGTTPATDHNLYVRGQYMYQSNYKAGLRVIDVADPKNPKEVGYFDTYPDGGENAKGYAGTWTNYPYFKSAKDGIVAVSSMSEGLFMVRFRPQTAQ